MITLIQGLPQRVVGLLGSEAITASDYEEVVVPAIRSATASGERASLLYVSAERAGYEAGALWEDAKEGSDYMADLDRIAVVTDDGRYRAAIKLVGVFMSGRVRVYGHDERALAEQWVSAPSD